MDMVYCLGHECSVRNTCLRYTGGSVVTSQDGFIRKCTSQKKYVQDESMVVKGR